eukprot:scaffold104856_cov63-Phaeocystis_antarctica.AAC.3
MRCCTCVGGVARHGDTGFAGAGSSSGLGTGSRGRGSEGGVTEVCGSEGGVTEVCGFSEGGVAGPWSSACVWVIACSAWLVIAWSDTTPTHAARVPTRAKSSEGRKREHEPAPSNHATSKTRTQHKPSNGVCLIQ